MADKDNVIKADNDFAQARFQAFLRDVVSRLTGRYNRLLNYNEVREKLRIGGPIYRGVETVPIEKIVGSLNRYQEFDRAFLPAHSELADRWKRISQAFYRGEYLPPVVLYKVGDVYFVVDGHHRVSVARNQGQKFIDAEVRECFTRVPVTPDLRPEDLERLGAKAEFLERTNLDRLRPDANIEVTIPDGYDRMLEHIAVHRYFMGVEKQRDIPEPEAVADWYDNVYLPVVQVIRESGILEQFSGKTEADLYLWVLDRQAELARQGHGLKPPEDAARDFLNSLDKE